MRTGREPSSCACDRNSAVTLAASLGWNVCRSSWSVWMSSVVGLSKSVSSGGMSSGPVAGVRRERNHALAEGGRHACIEDSRDLVGAVELGEVHHDAVLVLAAIGALANLVVMDVTCRAGSIK